MFPHQIQDFNNKYVIHNKCFKNQIPLFLYFDMYLNFAISNLCQTRILIPNFKKTANLQLFTYRKKCLCE
jgi:hypothetical protein